MLGSSTRRGVSQHADLVSANDHTTLEEPLTLELDLKEGRFGCNTLFGPQIRRKCFGRAARQEHSLAAAAP